MPHLKPDREYYTACALRSVLGTLALCAQEAVRKTYNPLHRRCCQPALGGYFSARQTLLGGLLLLRLSGCPWRLYQERPMLLVHELSHL